MSDQPKAKRVIKMGVCYPGFRRTKGFKTGSCAYENISSIGKKIRRRIILQAAKSELQTKLFSRLGAKAVNKAAQMVKDSSDNPNHQLGHIKSCIRCGKKVANYARRTAYCGGRPRKREYVKKPKKLFKVIHNASK